MKQAIQDNNSKVIIEIDTLIAIQTIHGKSIPPIHICNLVEDIKMLAKQIENISFVYYKRSANELAVG